MSSSSDTATPVVIITAPETLRLTTCVKDFLKEFITDPEKVRFLNCSDMPQHKLRTVEFMGFGLTELAALDTMMDSFRDYFLPEFKDEVLVIINASASHLVKKL